MRTTEETAVLLALLLKRSGQTRVRVSGKTIKRVAERSYLRSVFISALMLQLNDFGLIMTELERGGYGLIRASVLEGAPPVTAKKYLGDVLNSLKNKKSAIDAYRREVETDLTATDDDE